MKKGKTVTIKNCRIYLVGIIHGLEREGDRVKNAFEMIQPDCFALGVPEEDIVTIKKFVRDNIEFDMSPEQARFFECLSRYGKVSIPPSDLVVSHKLSVKEDIPLEALDIDDEHYADIFAKNVSLISFIWNSKKNKELRKKKFTAGTAEEFVEEWERNFNSTKPFKAIEKARERNMASRLFDLASQYERILAVIPYQRFDGVLDELIALKKHKNGGGITTWR
ncbi:MAG: hypothetical protein U9O96_05375 [Candidatus Thermoplasmatota archaeon]|nr:hypothetical protein [Candidatus Thermoplasmatota archaeon]